MGRFPGVLMLALLALLARAASPASLRAQPDPYTVTPLAEGVFAVIRRTPTTGASDANVLIVIRATDVVVVDANIYSASTR